MSEAELQEVLKKLFAELRQKFENDISDQVKRTKKQCKNVIDILGEINATIEQ